jgi:aryl carrier-like protein
MPPNGHANGIKHEETQHFASNTRGQSIGKPMGCVAWVLDPANPSRIVAVGAPGELHLEGALLSPGYLGDEEKTSHAFIGSPSWLKRGRLYRTGDLVRQDPESLEFSYIGRIDSQIKLHGQRVEALEIEEHIKSVLPQDVKTKTQVVVVLALLADRENPVLVCALSDHNTDLINHIDTTLNGKIPLWMMPSAYVSIAAIPTTATGKLDRRKLQEIIEGLPADQIRRPDQAVPRRSPSTVQEQRLQRVVADVLHIDQAEIGADDNLIKLGMDSISIMRFVAAAGREGLFFTASNVFRQPRLSAIASLATTAARDEVEEVHPFSLLPKTVSITSIKTAVGRLCSVEPSTVVDVMPTLPLQEGLVALSTRIAGAYTADFQHEFAADAQIVRAALARLSERWPILRTRIVQLPEQGMVQAILEQPVPCQEVTTKRREISTGHDQPMGLGTSLARAKLIHDDEQGTTCLFKLHHSIYDAWSLSMLFDDLRTIVETLHAGKTYNTAGPRLPTFQLFVKHVVGLDRQKTKDFWVSQCAGLEAPPFPSLLSPNYQPEADQVFERTLTDFIWPVNASVTPSNTVRAALALLLANRTATADSLFGSVVTGRQAPVTGIEAIPGPTIATVPLRVLIKPDESVATFLERVQKQATAMTEFEQVGLQTMRTFNEDTDKASRFQTLLITHTENSDQSSEPQISQTSVALTSTDPFGSFALTLHTSISPSGLKFTASFDSSIISTLEVQRMTGQLESVLRQLCAEDRLVGEIRTISNEDIRDIWQ